MMQGACSPATPPSLTRCRDDRLDELQVLEFSLPEDIERMKNEKKKGSAFYDRLDLMDDAACTPNSIEVCRAAKSALLSIGRVSNAAAAHLVCRL